MRILLLPALAAASGLPPPADVLSSMTAANNYWMAQPENFPTASASDCGWTRGAYYAGHTEHMKIATAPAERAALSAWANGWAAAHNWTCAGLWKDPNNLACGQGYAALYDAAPEDYKLALSVTMDKSVRLWEGCYDWCVPSPPPPQALLRASPCYRRTHPLPHTFRAPPPPPPTHRRRDVFGWLFCCF
jgi:hypothetical protein